MVATGASIYAEATIPPYLMWMTVMAAILNILIALESFKAYAQVKLQKG